VHHILCPGTPYLSSLGVHRQLRQDANKLCSSVRWYRDCSEAAVVASLCPLQENMALSTKLKVHTVLSYCSKGYCTSLRFETLILQKQITLVYSTPESIITYTYYYCNHFTALWTLSGKTQVSQYQKKHSSTHTYRGHQSSLICFFHLL